MPSAIITTGDLDRHNDRIDPRGVDFSKYLTDRPFVTIGHVRAMRVGRITALAVTPGVGLLVTWDWLATPLAMKASAAFERGELDGSSIGLRQIKAVKNREGGKNIESGTLDDVTLLPLQHAANPHARAMPTHREFTGGDPLPDPCIRGHGQPYTTLYANSTAGWNTVRDDLKEFTRTAPPRSGQSLSHECAPFDMKWLPPLEAAFVRERAAALGLI